MAVDHAVTPKPRTSAPTAKAVSVAARGVHTASKPTESATPTPTPTASQRAASGTSTRRRRRTATAPGDASSVNGVPHARVERVPHPVPEEVEPEHREREEQAGEERPPPRAREQAALDA